MRFWTRSWLGMAVMFIITPLLFWLPLPGLAGFIGGQAGGMVIQRPIPAALVAIFPATLFALLGFSAGIAVVEVFPFDSVFRPLFMVWVIASSIALLIGAYLGGRRAQSAQILIVNLRDLADVAQRMRGRDPRDRYQARRREESSDIFTEWRHVDSDDEPDTPPQR